jgi:hypothetical protein
MSCDAIGTIVSGGLARISAQLSNAAADPGISPTLRSIAPAGKLPDAPCIHTRLRRLAAAHAELGTRHILIHGQAPD